MFLKNHVKIKRIEKGISQKKMAEDLNISRQTLHSIESNKSNASLIIALKLSEYLGIEISRLFYLEQKEELNNVRNK